MSEIVHRGTHPVAYDDDYEAKGTEVSGWVGWVGFAGLVMILSGIFQAIEGLVALFRNDFFIVNSNQVLVLSNVRAWGWTNLIVGFIVVLAGFALFTGATWARVIAVLMAMGAAIVNLLAIPLYPVWSLISLTLSILVIYAVVAHGRELKES